MFIKMNIYIYDRSSQLFYCRVPGSNLLGGFEDQGYFSLSSRQSWLNEYQNLLSTYWSKVNCLLAVAL